MRSDIQSLMASIMSFDAVWKDKETVKVQDVRMILSCMLQFARDTTPEQMIESMISDLIKKDEKGEPLDLADQPRIVHCLIAAIMPEESVVTVVPKNDVDIDKVKAYAESLKNNQAKH